MVQTESEGPGSPLTPPKKEHTPTSDNVRYVRFGYGKDRMKRFFVFLCESQRIMIETQDGGVSAFQ